jgi:hypothetical protein
MHQFGKFRYDPGKYTAKTDSSDEEVEEVVEAEKYETIVTVAVEEETTSKPVSPKMKKHKTVLATDEDEYDAPWNQYAWIQELQLRVSIL